MTSAYGEVESVAEGELGAGLVVDVVHEKLGLQSSFRSVTLFKQAESQEHIDNTRVND